MIELKVSYNVYSEESILQTINAFKNYSKIQIKSKGQSVTIKFSHCKYDEKSTVLAFENYLIGVENAKK